MEGMALLEIGEHALWVLIKISLPLMLVALGVGLIISLFQALTQIQEMTLSFVPKMVAIYFSLALLLPFIGNELMALSEELSYKIEHISKAP